MYFFPLTLPWGFALTTFNSTGEGEGQAKNTRNVATPTETNKKIATILRMGEKPNDAGSARAATRRADCARDSLPLFAVAHRLA